MRGPELGQHLWPILLHNFLLGRALFTHCSRRNLPGGEQQRPTHHRKMQISHVSKHFNTRLNHLHQYCLLEITSIIPPLCCRYGRGGGISKHEGLCVLPLNMVNQKFYTIFFFWLSFLLIVTSFMAFFRLLVILSKEVRDFILRYIHGIKYINVSAFNKTMFFECKSIIYGT